MDLDNGVWVDHWVNASSGALSLPGQTGDFENDVGTFTADEMDGDDPITVRGVWDLITPTSCRWHQASSSDGGQTWTENW